MEIDSDRLRDRYGGHRENEKEREKERERKREREKEREKRKPHEDEPASLSVVF